jgi:hypothetical protein
MARGRTESSTRSNGAMWLEYGNGRRHFFRFYFHGKISSVHSSTRAGGLVIRSTAIIVLAVLVSPEFTSTIHANCILMIHDSKSSLSNKLVEKALVEIIADGIVVESFRWSGCRPHFGGLVSKDHVVVPATLEFATGGSGRGGSLAE